MTTLALAGNPNCGKTTIFNALTGSRHHVGNWPGVTVERRSGTFESPDGQVEVVDLPGTYSLSARSEDERIASQFVADPSVFPTGPSVDPSFTIMAFSYVAAQDILAG